MPAPLAIRPARREDVAAIVRLLADDHLGADREVVGDPPAPGYFAAFEKVAADPGQLLVVGEDAAGEVVATLQMTLIPSLSKQGVTLALIEAVRVASHLRGGGHGKTLMGWAMDEARRRGCQTIELLSHASRADAHRFYEQLGFARTHVGMKRAL